MSRFLLTDVYTRQKTYIVEYCPICGSNSIFLDLKNEKAACFAEDKDGNSCCDWEGNLDWRKM